MLVHVYSSSLVIALECCTKQRHQILLVNTRVTRRRLCTLHSCWMSTENHMSWIYHANICAMSTNCTQDTRPQPECHKLSKSTSSDISNIFKKDSSMFFTSFSQNPLPLGAAQKRRGLRKELTNFWNSGNNRTMRPAVFRRRRAAEPERRFGRWRRVFEWLECCVISSSEAVEDMTHDTVNSSPGSIFEFERTCSLAHKRARRANVR